MPFGLCNAHAVSERFINFVLRLFISEGCEVIYIDDIAIASQTLLDHFQRLGKVLCRLAEFRLEINLSDADFVMIKFSYCD